MQTVKIDMESSKRTEDVEQEVEEKGGRVSNSGGHSSSKQRREVMPASSLP